MQLGPRMRSRCGRAASSIAWRSSALKPAVSTIAARVPAAPRAPINAATVSAGVQITASSGTLGNAATEA